MSTVETRSDKKTQRKISYGNLQIGIGVAYLIVGTMVGALVTGTSVVNGNFGFTTPNFFIYIGLFIAVMGIIQKRTGFSLFKLIRKNKEGSQYHYNIWLEMKPGSLRFLALAVFLIFSIIGPLEMLMNEGFRPLSTTLLIVKIIGSGGTAASIILFGNRPVLLVITFLSFMSANIFSVTIASAIDGKSLKRAHTTEQEITLSVEQQDAISESKSNIGTTAILLLVGGYILFIVVIGKEGGQRLKLQAEVNVAKSIQDSLIPSKPFAGNGLNISGRMKPATQVAGDYYDYFQLAGESVAVAISDSSGHGVGAGIHAAMVKSGLRLQMQHNASPAEALMRLNKAMHGAGTKGMFSTMAYMVFEKENTVTVATAGHPPVLYYNAASNRTEQLRTPSLGIGISGNASYNQKEVKYSSGDYFLLFTDGITETTNKAKELFGQERLTAKFTELAGKGEENICDLLINEALSFSGKQSPEDDISLVCVKIV